MSRTLPFMNGLRAFEAAARHGSFAAGGAELHVSPAAVSRLVRLLEQRLGIVLFERRSNRLALTPAGGAYRAGLGAIFDELERLTVATVAQAGQRRLILGVGPSFASQWLIPRLADWHARAPGIQVRVKTGGAAAAFDEGWSCGIRLGDGDWPGFVATPLFAADLLPVCAPAMAAGLGQAGELAGVPLLRVAHAEEDWPLWLAAQGLAGKVAARGPVFDFYGQAQQAAADGLGVAMGIRPYIDDALRQGRLVAPFAASVPKEKGWFLIHRAGREEDVAFTAFRAWILEAAAGGGRASGQEEMVDQDRGADRHEAHSAQPLGPAAEARAEMAPEQDAAGRHQEGGAADAQRDHQDICIEEGQRHPHDHGVEAGGDRRGQQDAEAVAPRA